MSAMKISNRGNAWGRFLWLACLLGAGIVSATQAQDVCDGVTRLDVPGLAAAPVITNIPGEPLFVTSPPGDTERFFIAAQSGVIYLWKRGWAPDAAVVFLDLSSRVQAGGEQGLLGLAFPPNFATSRFFFVNFTESGTGNTIVGSFQVSATDPDLVSLATLRELLTLVQPASNHNGGMLAFDDSGYLYISTGDGGGGGDGFGLCGNGQNQQTLLGKILRIFPYGTGDSSDCGVGSYRVPPNPFSDGPGGVCDEIFAYGLRNPWRFSFDRENGDLYVGDVGQSCWEEVNHVDAASVGGQNFGWRQMEGKQCFDPANAFNCNPVAVTCSGSPDCLDPSLTLPVLDYSTGCSVIGGYAYRGCRMDLYQGTYFYGDYCEGALRSFKMNAGAATQMQDWTSQVDPLGNQLPFQFSSMSEDQQGELYLTRQSGTIMKLVPPFQLTESSGPGADAFLLDGGGGLWTWEDVQYTTMVPVDYYRIYRGLPNDLFQCVYSSTTPDWIGGDTVTPNAGELLAYLVTAVDSSGTESSPGGSGRQLTNPCAAP